MEYLLPADSIVLLPELSNTLSNKTKIRKFFTNSLVRNNSLKSFHNRNAYYIKKIKTQLKTEKSTHKHSIQTFGTSTLNSLAIQKKSNFIKKKLNAINNSPQTKRRIMYRKELNTIQSMHYRTKPRQNLCQSFFKKLSCKFSDSNHNSKSKGYQDGLAAIHANFEFFSDNIRSLNVENTSKTQKVQRYFKAYKKTQTQKVLRLLQKQQQLEQKYSCLKVSLKRRMQKNANKKLSKKDFCKYSKSFLESF